MIRLFMSAITGMTIIVSNISIVTALTGAEVYKVTSKSIYTVEVYLQGEQTVLGSAVAISSNILVTNCHVISNGDKIYIKNKSEAYFTNIYKTFSSADICLLIVNGINLSPVKMKNSNSLEVGAPVYAIGSPYGFTSSFSQGVLSQKHYSEGNTYLQTDTSISPGSSGGGLFDSDGDLIGITTMKIKEIGLAVAVDMLVSHALNNTFTEMKSEQMPDKTKKYLEKSTSPGDTAEPKIVVKEFEEDTEGFEEDTYDNKVHKYIEQTTTIATHGKYGRSNIVLVRDIYGCSFYIPGITKSGKQYGSAVIFPELDQYIFVFPNSATLQEAINSANKTLVEIMNKTIGVLATSKSSLWLVDGRYAPPKYNGTDMFKINSSILRKDSYVAKLDTDVIKQFIDDNDFYILYDVGGEYKVVSFGLWGFSDAVSNYSSCIDSFK